MVRPLKKSFVHHSGLPSSAVAMLRRVDDPESTTAVIPRLDRGIQKILLTTRFPAGVYPGPYPGPEWLNWG